MQLIISIIIVIIPFIKTFGQLPSSSALKINSDSLIFGKCIIGNDSLNVIDFEDMKQGLWVKYEDDKLTCYNFLNNTIQSKTEINTKYNSLIFREIKKGKYDGLSFFYRTSAKYGEEYDLSCNYYDKGKLINSLKHSSGSTGMIELKSEIEWTGECKEERVVRVNEFAKSKSVWKYYNCEGDLYKKEFYQNGIIKSIDILKNGKVVYTIHPGVAGSVSN